MKLYHGSNIEIHQIDLSKGRCGKDFGQGFYLSADLQQARRMAELTVARQGSGEPVVTSFDFDERVLESGEVKVLQFNCYTPDWARFIHMNRTNETNHQAHDYDVVFGPIANDKVGIQMRLFTEQFISVEELVKRLKFVTPTFQYFFATERAISFLKRC